MPMQELLQWVKKYIFSGGESVNEYKLVIVVETKDHAYIRLFINNALANPDGLIKLRHSELDQLFKDLFRSSKGNCIKCRPANL